VVSAKQKGQAARQSACPERLWKGRPMSENTKLIPLSQGKFAIVDAADYEELAQFKWCVRRDRRAWYAGRNIKRDDGRRATILMHRAILNPSADMFVDHINHDGLDNRRTNLRVCTQSENQRNCKSRAGATSKFLGVHWHKQMLKWQARIRINGQQFHLGLYADEEAAARAYDVAACEHFGEFANPNFPKP
jgi:hypothetical protein